MSEFSLSPFLFKRPRPGLPSNAQLLLDFLSLPLDNTKEIASIDCFIRTSRLLHLRDILPETQITLLEVLEKLSKGVYAAQAASNPPIRST